MKKTLLVVLCVLLLSSLCVAVAGCGGSTIESGYSKGLEFTVNADGKTCSVTGIGTCTDTEIVIPATSPDGYAVTSIGDRAFSDCGRLTSVTIPDGVVAIGAGAFVGCTELMSISIPKSLTTIDVGPHYAATYVSAFSMCYNLKKIYITDIEAWCNISEVGHLMMCSTDKQLYLNNKLLTEVVIPNGVTTISDGVFYNCSGLTSVTIPNSVTSIGYDVFAYCSGLKNITIPESVIDIGRAAFYGCSGLTSIVIPSSVTAIDEYTLYGCGLASVYYKGTEEQWNNISISYSGNEELTDATIYYYSETEPKLNADGSAYGGNYWHYDADGKTPVIWKK